ncbi:hypothetical protein BDW02DRAFT_586384 [Decorospora gaudefroyi]|uniref:Uncharacterized protein n=1 Tax=Decorospora gaudefroyi TaxID=184978 RepID=A0A6A5KKV0_9PLEO|nr:hypothetical protein BDW02DRAFT_586384 [Decorospora gaudefroyi]
MGKRMRAPNCTHVVVDRVFGRDQYCENCRRTPSIGFLYECRQDSDAESLHDHLLSQHVDKIEPVKSDLRQELERIGMSESIILTAESGHYTEAQLAKLMELKLEVRQTISDAREASQANETMRRLVALAKAPCSTDGTCNSTPTRDTKPPGCSYKVCHTCRPYYRDRLYISFEAVLAGGFPPMKRDDMEQLPTKSVQIMRTIGLKAQPLPSSMTLDTSPSTLPTSNSFATCTSAPHTASSHSSELTFKTTQTDMDEISAQRRPRRRFYKMGRRSSGDIARDLSRVPSLLTPQGLKSAVQGIFRPGRESSSEGSNITLPLPRTGTARSVSDTQPVRDFDIGALRRVRQQKERNEFKNGTCMAGFENVRSSAPSSEGGASSSDESSEFSVYSFATQDGREIEISGVELTEEAAETRTPDIVAIELVGVQNLNGGVVGPDDQVGAQDATEADIGLQSIMAQV